MTIKRTFLFLLILVCIFSCKKNEKTTSPSTPRDELSDAQIKTIESIGIDTISTFSNALFSDGSSMNVWLQNNAIKSKVTDDVNSKAINGINISTNSFSDEKRMFITVMTEVGLELTEHTTQYPNQNKIAYVFGSRYLTNPANYPGAKCQEKKYGLDCSGMIYQMANQGTISLDPGGTTDYISTKIWNKAFKNTLGFESLQMSDLSALDATQLEAGDIIVASGVHMGMVFFNGLNKEVLNSLGRPEYSCEINSDAYHGPVITTDVIKWVKTFGSNYHVLRAVQIGAPGLTTNAIGDITSNSAVSGGNVTEIGDSPITARGICWNTTGNPTISDYKTSNGTGTGSYASTMTGLTNKTTYYVRAYATNGSGTAYGKILSFTTTDLGNGYYINFTSDGKRYSYYQYINKGYVYYVKGQYQGSLIGSDNPTADSFSIGFYSSYSTLAGSQFNILPDKNGTNYFYLQWDNPGGDYYLDYLNNNPAGKFAITSFTKTTIKGTFSGTFSKRKWPPSLDSVKLTNGEFYLPLKYTSDK